jgi:hypothetical protein
LFSECLEDILRVREKLHKRIYGLEDEIQVFGVASDDAAWDLSHRYRLIHAFEVRERI